MVNGYFMQLGAMQGWQCPVCKRVLAPFLTECPCQGEGRRTVTISSSTITKDNKLKGE